MLYPRKQDGTLDPGLFADPTAEYRAAPFWAWNCRLDAGMLARQIESLKEMGFGGFHMHSRTGMATPYLSDEFMGLVKSCVDKARDEKMLAWLYDEDRWPSGSAGGIVTKDHRYRARSLVFSPDPPRDGTDSGDTVLPLSRYDIVLDHEGCLAGYRMLEDGEDGANVWHAFRRISAESPWYNNQAYVNTLDKEAIAAFIRVTHEAYAGAVGEDFGGVVPAIFTDEPQFEHKTTLGFASDRKEVRLPWSDDLPDTFFGEYGEKLLPHLPELIWELPGGRASLTRYRYHDHVARRFAEAFADSCGDWCRAHGLMLTGHMMEEPTLRSQTAALGEAMRSYRAFDLPGIDMLCDLREYNTAKQAQSAAHQFGYCGVLSELYGVTGWDFDFRGHKLQGDWQAALGVTVRVPHLSWVSMEGEAKRDYPASISYQVPWYREYPLVENHFARVNTALVRGTPLVRVGMIHPVESYWLSWGPSEQTAEIREQMDTRFTEATEWLLFGLIDFDFISESLLPGQCPAGGCPLEVGRMRYDTLIVPGCRTLRSSTLQRLEAFLKQGGRLIVMGGMPELADAQPDGGRLDFLKSAQQIPFEKHALLQALEPVRLLDIRNASGTRTDHLLAQMREDGDSRWLFIANGRKPGSEDAARPRRISLRIAGQWEPEWYDTMDGTISPAKARLSGNTTIIDRTIHTHDSLLFRLRPASGGGSPAEEPSSAAVPATAVLSSAGQHAPSAPAEGFIGKVPVTLSEPNTLLLDIAEFALDGGEYEPPEEILRIDNLFRRRLGWPTRMDSVAQPWTIPPERPEHAVSLRFAIRSERDFEGVSLALENPENTEILLNGQPVSGGPDGWYTDESIRTVPLPGIREGMNSLELRMPFGRSSNLEWCYLLGDFGVKTAGTDKTLTDPVRELAFGDIVPQGLPFYGGNITYRMEIEGSGRDVHIHVPSYRGALVGVLLDGVRTGSIAFDPYTLTIPELPEGRHEIGLVLFGNRYNTFGALHNCDSSWTWHGPNAWRTEGDRWSYEYVLKKTGILKSPAISVE